MQTLADVAAPAHGVGSSALPHLRTRGAAALPARAGCAACITVAALLLAAGVQAETLSIPLTLDSAFLRAALIAQLYRGEGTTARVTGDDSGCNTIVLSDPVVSFADGAVRVRSAVDARSGSLVSGACVLATGTKGKIELLLAPRVDPDGRRVSFLVLDSQLAVGSPLTRFATGSLWDAVKESVHPYFERWTLDLGGPLADLRTTLPALAGARDAESARARAIADSIALASAAASPTGLRVVLRAEIPLSEPRPEPAPASETPLTAQEYARFAAELRRFDGFLTFVVKRAGADAALDADRQQLLAILLDARRSMLELLDPARPRAATDADPLRALFVDTWSRLAPVLRRVAGVAKGDRPWRWIGFIASGDALALLDRLGPRTGVEVSTDGLRRLARAVAPDATGDPTVATDAVDPELREIFGFGAPLPLPPDDSSVSPDDEPGTGAPPVEEAPPATSPEGSSGPPSPAPGPAAPDGSARIAIDWLFVEPEPLATLDARLRHWVPRRDELDRYLPAMRELLARAAERALAAKPRALPETFRFRDLVLATAWKESCWRQFVQRHGRAEALRSPVGALGVMQVSPKVWRGFYDVPALGRDPLYNAEAGSEILLHYLVDYAFARGEQRKGSGVDGAVRATYAAYNGGPGHLGRWRRPTTPVRLRRIDDAFWKAYEAVRAGRELDVATCYGA